MTGMAARRPVLFVEEPVYADGVPRWEFTTVASGVTVCRPHTSVREGGFNDEQNVVLGPMLKQLLGERTDGRYDFWFYTPMALPLAEGLDPRVVIYDNMDDLSAFKFAPPQLIGRESALLARADVVFTGGPSLHRAMSGRHPNVHCFASSVDASHFAAAAGPLPEPPEQAAIPRPRLGFFGVIDERFDLDLLASLADARPGWHFVMVGPTAKIDVASLPRRANIHYVGGQAYASLPAFLAGWDVALMPFARNESTRRISPTKVLEYMAAGKPIVSTRIEDIAGPYGSMVGLADDPAEFLGACERALGETTAERGRRLERYEGVLSRTSWEATVRAMSVLIEAASGPSNQIDEPAAGPARRVVVIGAGPTGLSAAYHLGADSLLLEANTSVGGWCRSLEDHGFTFDCAGHIMFSNDSYVHEMYEMLLGENVHWQEREAWIYSKSVYTRYPFQGSLYGLPADVIKECIVGAIESRFGELQKKPDPAPAQPGIGTRSPSHASTNGHTNGAASVKDTLGQHPDGDPKDLGPSECRADGHVEGTVTPVQQASAVPGRESREPENFEEFIYKVWGAGIAKHFAIPYNQKIWAVPLSEMETSWLGGRVPMPDLEEMIEGALTQKPKPMGPNARFGYPLRGGFQALMDGFLPHLSGELCLGARVQTVSALRRVVTLVDGEEIPFEQLVSTMPLPALICSMGDEVPDHVQRAARALRHTSVRCVNIGVGREALTEKHWIYYPEDTIFHRIFVQGNASPHCNPPGGFGLTCEITYGPLKPLPCDGDDLIRRCIADCIRVGIFDADDAILTANQVDMPFAYVVYDHARPRNVSIIREWLESHDILLAGRYSEWEYYNSDHAFLAGKKVAQEARRRLDGPRVSALSESR